MKVTKKYLLKIILGAFFNILVITYVNSIQKQNKLVKIIRRHITL